MNELQIFTIDISLWIREREWERLSEKEYVGLQYVYILSLCDTGGNTPISLRTVIEIEYIFIYFVVELNLFVYLVFAAISIEINQSPLLQTNPEKKIETRKTKIHHRHRCSNSVIVVDINCSK